MPHLPAGLGTGNSAPVENYFSQVPVCFTRPPAFTINLTVNQLYISRWSFGSYRAYTSHAARTLYLGGPIVRWPPESDRKLKRGIHMRNWKRIITFSMAALLAFCLSRSARADTMTLDLTALNLGSSTYPGPFVTLTVTVPAGGGDATVAVKGDTSGGFAYTLDELALNLSSSATASGLPSGWTKSGSHQISSFGRFNTLVGTNGGFSASLSAFTFTLTPKTGEFSNASDVFLTGDDPAAAHVFVSSPDCKGACTSGFAADPAPASATPEPASLALLAVGLFAMAFLTRHKFARHINSL